MSHILSCSKWMALALTGITLTAEAQFVRSPVKPNFVKGELLVAPAAGIRSEELTALYEARGGKLKRVIDKLNVHHITVPEHALEAVEQALRNNPKIRYVERNALGQSTQTLANDPYFSQQWHLPLISATGAWDVSTGASTAPIAILDAGFDSNNLDISAKFVSGFNAVTGTNDFRGNSASSCWSHGTWVASTAAAAGNNSLGASGVAWQNPIIPVLVFDSNCSLQIAYAAAGVIGAVDRGAKVINMSFIFYWSPPPQTFIDAIKYAIGKGVVVVAAAGNDNQIYAKDSYGNTYPSYPQTVANVITVAATDRYDVRTSWSNYGPYIAVSAPGLNVIATGPNGSLGQLWGTSFSSPIVAGVAALVLGANPNLSNLQVADILKQTAVDLGDAGWDQYYGAGRVNAAAAVQRALTTVPEIVDLQAPTVAISSPSGGSVVSGLISVEVAAQDNIGVTRVELYAGGRLIASDETAPFSFGLDTRNFADGTLSLQARAFDAAGNSSSSSNVSVSVRNTVIAAPMLTSISPASVKLGQSVESTIVGSGFRAGLKVSLSGGGGSAPSVRVLSVSADGKSIVVRISAKSGGKNGATTKIWDVNVTNADGQSSRLPKAFTTIP